MTTLKQQMKILNNQKDVVGVLNVNIERGLKIGEGGIGVHITSIVRGDGGKKEVGFIYGLLYGRR